MTEKDLIIQNQRREIAKYKKAVEHLETMVLILKAQVEELHQQIKRERLAMSAGFRGNPGGPDNAGK